MNFRKDESNNDSCFSLFGSDVIPILFLFSNEEIVEKESDYYPSHTSL